MNANYEKNVIEMTAKEAKAAGKVGTKEFDDLKTLRSMNPTFAIVIVKPSRSKKKDNMKGLTYEYMEKYIKAHDKADENMKTFNTLRGCNDKGEREEMALVANYFAVKDWFLETYPEVEKRYKAIDKILNKNNADESAA